MAALSEAALCYIAETHYSTYRTVTSPVSWIIISISSSPLLSGVLVAPCSHSEPPSLSPRSVLNIFSMDTPWSKQRCATAALGWWCLLPAGKMTRWFYLCACDFSHRMSRPISVESGLQLRKRRSMMLILTRRIGETINIGNDISVRVLDIQDS